MTTSLHGTHGRPNELDKPPERTKQVRLGIYRTQIPPSEHDIKAISGQWLDIAEYPDSRRGFWLDNCEFSYGNAEKGWPVPFTSFFVFGQSKQ